MNLRFTDAETAQRFRDWSWKTAKMENSLDRAICLLLRWQGNGTIEVSRDFHEPSFFFQEMNEDGTRGVCGGIIFHGEFDNGGDGSAPTFSVNLDNSYGYSIHT